MSGVNKVILIGRLGKDPEVRAFENNVKKATFPLATSEFRKDKEGNKIELTEWHNIVCWRNLAETAEQFLTKGKLIYLEGKIRTRNWEDNGVKKYITEIEAGTFTMLSPKEENKSTETQVLNVPPPPPVVENAPEPSAPDFSDDLPF
ncbi:MAG: single-stranded DNA-binding protein [Bacteroidetes bacterium]|nr:single-stranded DNA-binding protein [Bacteroidota bacterium]MCL1968284.1 single-stranded DNA-binding protein [Bacteroidota bacterium]